MNIAVLGAGAWGSALAIAYARHAAFQVTLWGRDAAAIMAMSSARENTRYLAGLPFPAALQLSTDLPATVAQADVILIVTPIAGLRSTVTAVRACREASPCPVLWACKGLEAGTGLLPHQVMAQAWPDLPISGALTGPSFAKEVAADLPAALTLAADSLENARLLAKMLHIPRLRLYADDDLVGVEVGGAIKNTIAIAAGVSDGLGFGMNARAALLTRGLAETARFAEALGGRAQTLSGLAGIGDLILTATGDLSRNRRVGQALARGESLPAILAGLGHVAEGVSTTREVHLRALALGVEMPIVAATYALLYEAAPADSIVRSLLERAPKTEHYPEPL